MAPAGALFGAAAALRAALYRYGLLRQERLAGPVISVGNLSVGGSGKTPVVARIAEILREEGLPVAILSRGYAGSFRGDALVVGDGVGVVADASVAGDEPVMLARSLPGVVVAVGLRRDVVGRAVEARFGRRVHVLDDGFQHLRLSRDLDLICVDLGDLEDRPLPAGRLREFHSAASRADLVLLTGVDEAAPERVAAALASLGPGRTFRVGRRALGFFAVQGGSVAPPARPFLLSGIARPERFEQAVRVSVGNLAGGAAFPDHHRFTEFELREVGARARSTGADAIVTTAKDAVRLPAVALDLPVLVFRVAADIPHEDEGRFRDRLLAAARGKRTPLRSGRGRQVLEDGAAALARAVVSRLPRRAVLSLGRALGRILGDLDRRHVAIAADNLRCAFPHWDEPRLLRTALSVYAHFGEVLLDIFWLSRRSRDQVLSLVDVVGGENVEAAMAAGRGAIMVTCHIGNWELHGVAHGLFFGPIGVVARPIDNPHLDRRLCAFRTMGGNGVIYKQKALSQVMRAMREGRGVAILIDQNVQEKDGIFVEFFGRSAATTTVAAAVGLKTGCALVPCYTTIGPDGRYGLFYEPPVAWTPTGERSEDLARLTQALTSRIEAWVRERPEQWLWIHRRWKTQPTTQPTRQPTTRPEKQPERQPGNAR